MPTDNLSTQLVDAVNTHVIDLMRVSGAVRADVVALLNSLEHEITDKINRGVGDGTMTAARMHALLIQTQKTIATAYTEVSRTAERSLIGVAEASSRHVVESVNAAVLVPIASVAFTQAQLTSLVRQTYIGGRFAQDWWDRQGKALQDRFAVQMRLGLLQGESVGQLVQRVRGTRAGAYADGLMTIPRNQAETLVRTAVISVANTARLQSFIENRDLIKGVQWVSTLDGRTTQICIALDGLTWALPESDDPNDYGGYTPQGHTKNFPGPTAHFNCRSTQISVLKSFSEIAGPKAKKGPRRPLADTFQARLLDKGFSEEEAAKIEKDTRASMDGQVSKEQGYEGWLNSKSAQFQDDLLGETAANLWRQGRLTLNDLTNQDNRPLSPQQLLEKVAKLGKITPPLPVATLYPPPALDATPDELTALRNTIADDLGEADKARANVLKEWEQAGRDYSESFRLSHDEQEAIKARWSDAKARYEAADAEFQSRLQTVRRSLSIPKAEQGPAVSPQFQAISSKLQSATRSALEMLREIASPEIVNLPDISVTSTRKSRAFFRSWEGIKSIDGFAQGRMFMARGNQERTVLHELMHWIELNDTETSRRVTAFLDSRTEGMPIRRLKDLYPELKYRPDEFTRQGVPAWLNDYMGKVYKPSSTSRGHRATEVLAVGIEYYWYAPQLLIAQDPELFNFIYYTLRDLDVK